MSERKTGGLSPEAEGRIVATNLQDVMQKVIGEFGALVGAAGHVNAVLVAVTRDQAIHYVSTMQPQFTKVALRALLKRSEGQAPDHVPIQAKAKAFMRRWAAEERRPRPGEPGAKAPAITTMRVDDTDVPLHPPLTTEQEAARAALEVYLRGVLPMHTSAEGAERNAAALRALDVLVGVPE